MTRSVAVSVSKESNWKSTYKSHRRGRTTLDIDTDFCRVFFMCTLHIPQKHVFPFFSPVIGGKQSIYRKRESHNSHSLHSERVVSDEGRVLIGAINIDIFRELGEQHQKEVGGYMRCWVLL